MESRVLSEKQLKNIKGGSNDGFWERYGIALGSYAKCSIQSLSISNPVDRL
jgi:bacteriocin-like protein